VRQRLTTSRKRVLRRRGRPRRRSVDSEQTSRVIEPRKQVRRGGRRCSTSRRLHRGTQGSWVRRLRRGRRAGRVGRGTTGTWEISSPLVNTGHGNPEKKIRGLRESRACAQEPKRDTNQARTQSTAERRRTKRSGTGDEKSETLVVPVKRGTRLTRTREGKGRPAMGIVRGKDDRDPVLHHVSTKLARIAEPARRRRTKSSRQVSKLQRVAAA